MEIKNILICGDSFSSTHLSSNFGWPTLLANKYKVTNVSSPGIGEYKILQKIKLQNLTQYDLIIISHTSPYRVHSQENPLYNKDNIYKHSDILFADAESKTSSIAKSICDYFKLIFDPEYYTFIHTTCCKEIDHLTRNIPTIHMTNFDWNGLYQFTNLINFYKYWQNNKGPYCHYNCAGNEQIASILLDRIKLESLCQTS